MAYVGQGIKGGTFSVLDTSGNTYNGSNTTFDLGTQVGSPAQLLVSHDGVIQKPVTDYTIATGGTQITFTTAPASGASIFITEISGAVGAPMNRDINGDELILDADGDTSITADTDDQIDIRVAGTDQITIKDGAVSPVTDNDVDLGTTSLEFKDGYFDGTLHCDVLDLAGTEHTSISAGLTGIDDQSSSNDDQITISDTAVIINEDSDDVDFRVESNGNTHMIMSDGGTNHLGLGSAAAAGVFLTIKDGTGIDGDWWINADNVHATNPNGMIMNTSGSANDSTAQKFFAAQDSGTMRFMVFVDGDVVNHDNSYGAISDQRIKQNIVDANSQWDDIKALKVRNFKKKDDVRQYGEDKAWAEIGLVAQEAELVSPKLIKENPPSVNDILSDSAFGTLVDDTSSPKYYQDGDTIPSGKKIGDEKLDGSGNVIYNKKVGEEKQKVKSIKYSVLYMKAIKALQEAQTRIETLETKVKALEDA